MQPTREELAKRVLDRMRNFTEKLESGVPIECTHVTVEHTPDGTLTTRQPGVVNSDRDLVRACEHPGCPNVATQMVVRLASGPDSFYCGEHARPNQV